MASRTISIKWQLDLVDRATRPMLAQDRAVRRSIDETGRAWSKQARDVAKSAGQTSASARQAAAAAKAQGRAAAAAGVDISQLARAQADAYREARRLVSASSQVESSYRRQGAAARRSADEQVSAYARVRTAAAHAATSVGTRVGHGTAALGGALAGGAARGAGAVATGGVLIGAAAFAGAAKAGAGYNKVIDAQRVAFTTLFRSGKRAADFMGQLQALALKSPVLNIEQTGNAARSLLAYGVNLKQVMPLVKALGDQSAASGKSIEEVMPRAAMAIGQIASKGKLQTEELNQLAESVGLSRDRIRKALGMTRDAFTKTFTPGNNISAAKAIPAIQKALEDQSRGAATRLAKTTAGRVDRAKEVIARAAGQLSRPIYDGVGSLAGKLADALQRVDFTKAGQVIGSKVRGALTQGVNVARDVPGIARAALSGLKGDDPARQGGGRSIVRGPGGRVQTVLQGKNDPTTAQKIAASIGGVARSIGQTAADAGKQLVDAFKPALPFFQNVLLPLLEGIGKGVLISVVGAFKVLVPTIRVVSTVLGAIGKVAAPLRPVFQGIGVAIGFLFAGPILKGIGALGKLGGIFKLLGGAANIARAPIRALGGLFNGVSASAGLVGKGIGRLVDRFGNLKVIKGYVLTVFDDVVGTLKSIPGKLGAIATGAVKAYTAPYRFLGHKIADAVRGKLGDLIGFFARVGKSIVGAIVNAIKGAPGAIADAVSSVVPGPVKGAVSKILGRRRGGMINRYQGGGLVDAMISPGERIVEPGGVSWTVPGQRVAADSVHAQLPAGAAVLTSDGQRRMGEGASLASAIATQLPHFAKGGIVPGKYTSTAYGPPWGGIQGTGTTATGVNLKSGRHVYGVAVDPRMISLGSSVYAWPNPFNYGGAFRAFDTGGAIKGRRVDFYDWRGRKAQNAWGRRPITISSKHISGSSSSSTTTSDTTLKVPLTLGRSATRAGLVGDALSQGVQAGLDGLSRAEITAGARGARGARVNPILAAIAQAQTATTRDVSVKGSSSSSSTKLPSGVYRPSGTWNPKRLPIARWISPYLSYGASHGWSGTVQSGYRSRADQARIYASGVRPAARPGTSNHEGTSYPRGAVDVSAAASLAAALAKRKGPHLLSWAGAKDPVHFSHPHGGSYRRGGIVGYRTGGTITSSIPRATSSTPQGVSGSGTSVLSRALGRAQTFVAGSFDALDQAIGSAALSKIEALRATVLAQVRKGGSKKTIQRLQGVLDLIDFEVGRRIGALEASVQTRQASADYLSGSVDRLNRKRGIDPASAAGIRSAIGMGDYATDAAKRNVADLQKALKIAKRTGDKATIADLQAQLSDAFAAVDESITAQIERRRDLIRAKAQENVDTASFGADVASALKSGLDTSLRADARTHRDVNGQLDGQSSPGAMLQQANALQQSIVPALQAQKTALEAQLGALASIGDTAGARQAYLGVLQAGNDIAGAMQDAADLVAQAQAATRQALLDAQQARVDDATHGETMSNLGLARLELEQRLAGTYDGGGQARADYITNNVLPALQAELVALQGQQAVAQEQGDPVLARQVGEAIAGKQNDILQATLDATEEVASNTDPQKVGGGALAFGYGSETLTDSIIAAGNGA